MFYGAIPRCMLGFLLIFLIKGCTSATDVSREPPYSGMIGDRYIIQEPMVVYRSKCWSIGNPVLTSSVDYPDCFSGDPITEISYGSQFTVRKVILQQFGTYGLCPQMTVSIEGLDALEVFLPLCSVVKSISWLDSDRYVFRRGDPIKIKEEYARKKL